MDRLQNTACQPHYSHTQPCTPTHGRRETFFFWTFVRESPAFITGIIFLKCSCSGSLRDVLRVVSWFRLQLLHLAIMQLASQYLNKPQSRACLQQDNHSVWLWYRSGHGHAEVEVDQLVVAACVRYVQLQDTKDESRSTTQTCMTRSDKWLQRRDHTCMVKAHVFSSQLVLACTNNREGEQETR